MAHGIPLESRLQKLFEDDFDFMRHNFRFTDNAAYTSGLTQRREQSNFGSALIMVVVN